jgi:hypothetical protein
LAVLRECKRLQVVFCKRYATSTNKVISMAYTSVALAKEKGVKKYDKPPVLRLRYTIHARAAASRCKRPARPHSGGVPAQAGQECRVLTAGTANAVPAAHL